MQASLTKGEVVGGELVVPGRNAPALLDLIEEPLDQVAVAIEIGAPGNVAWLVREHRSNNAPLVVTEFIAQNSQFRRWSLNHSNICLDVSFPGLSRHRMVHEKSPLITRQTSGMPRFPSPP